MPRAGWCTIAGPNHREIVLTTNQVPVIDIGRLPDDRSAMDALHEACRDWGFFQVVGHGVEERLRQETHRQMQAFFSLPLSAKRAIMRTAENPWGFYDQELTKNVRDWKEIFDVGPSESDGPLAGASPQWPDTLPQLKNTLMAYSAECERVCQRLLSAVGSNLGMAPDYLASNFEPAHTSFLRLNFYPACEDPAAPDSPTTPTDGHLGISHHTDAGTLTVVMQDTVPGLQVERNGQWHIIEPVVDAFVINIGDIVQVWSNDMYKAPLHRVITHTDRERYSAAFFFNPASEANYAPLPSMCDEQHPPLYESINWGEFRAGRTAGDYADYGEEIQISQFRTADGRN